MQLKKIFLFNNKLKPITRLTTYYTGSDSTLNVLTSNKEHYKFSMKRADFQPRAEQVFMPQKPDFLKYIIHPLTFSVLLNLILLSIILYIRNKKIATKKILPPKFIPKFEDHEKEVIRLIYEAPDHSVNLYEVDYLLGSVGKSLDSQSKRRSTLMRSINEKYSAITGDNNALIATKRVKGDRRMFRYFLDPKKYEEIKHLV